MQRDPDFFGKRHPDYISIPRPTIVVRGFDGPSSPPINKLHQIPIHKGESEVDCFSLTSSLKDVKISSYFSDNPEMGINDKKKKRSGRTAQLAMLPNQMNVIPAKRN